MRKIVVLLVLLASGCAYAEESVSLRGFKRETLLEVNRIIDTAGHSESWFNQNWETAAAPFKAECPTLTRSELKAAARNAWDVHIADRARVRGIDTEALWERMSDVAIDKVIDKVRDLVSANNKASMTKAINNGAEAASYVSQTTNLERIQAEHLLSVSGASNIQALGRDNIVITAANGQEYMIAMKKSTADLKEAMRKFPNRTFALTPEDFAALSEREPELAKRAVTFDALGDSRTKQEILDDAMKLYDNTGRELAAFEQNAAAETRAAARKSLAKSALKTVAPYATFGGITALAENWEFIRDAYDNKAEWSRVLTRTGADFAGCTVTPMMIDGLLAVSGKKVALMSTMKQAGMGHTLGYFCWNAGKEYYSYAVGDISREEMTNRVKHLAAKEVEMLPVNVLAYLVSGAGYTFFVPVVIIGGSFAIQRVHSWYEAKRWRECIYLDDVKAVLGDELMNAFTLAQPERRAGIAEPERIPSLANP